MKLSKYVKLVKGGGYCMVAHVEDSGIWLGTRSAIFRATELPDMVGEEQVRTVLDMPEKAWEKVHLAEQIKESDYIRYTVRKMESGQRYLVVHDGFEVLAAIMPVRIVTEKYLADLSEFQALCTEQFYREQARGEFAAQETEEPDAEQIGMEDAPENEN